jgi:hypothetical protein
VRIATLHRFPVKGLAGERIETAVVEAEGAIPCDRIYAIAHGATAFDPANPAFQSKRHFLMLMSEPRMAALKVRFDETDHRLTLEAPDGRMASGSLLTSAGRGSINALMDDFAGDLSNGGPPRIVAAPQHRFFDVPQDYLSIIGLASIADLSRHMDMRLDPLRFRANVYVENIGPWEEQNWVGRAITCGDVVLRVVSPIERCAATNVNLETAEADANVPASLMKHYGHRNMGVYARVEKGGHLRAGAALAVQN